MVLFPVRRNMILTLLVVMAAKVEISPVCWFVARITDFFLNVLVDYK